MCLDCLSLPAKMGAITEIADNVQAENNMQADKTI
jgi:hypothetical protein